MLTSNRNAMANSKNAWQGKTKKVLCCCSAGLLRSPTTANILHKTFGYNTRACGTYQDFALIPLSQALVYWADEVVFVNRDNFNGISEEDLKLFNGKRVVVLDIPDEFEWGNPELEQIILQQYGAAQEEAL